MCNAKERQDFMTHVAKRDRSQIYEYAKKRSDELKRELDGKLESDVSDVRHSDTRAAEE